VDKNVLPGGVPNTPARRLTFRLRNAASLWELAEAYRRARPVPALWAPKHGAAILMRAARLMYYRWVPRGRGGGQRGGGSSGFGPFR
jgi:hypothetical protein